MGWKVFDRAWLKTRLETRLLGPVTRMGANDSGDIMEQNWDVLIILDACRCDTLREVKPAHWPDFDCVLSNASNTKEFYQKNFANGPYTDTVVVTAQPRTTQLRRDAFHTVEKVYEDHWDESLGTLPPDEMADLTIRTASKYPNKRIVAHWVQPHYPFIASDRFQEYKGRSESIWNDLKRGRVDGSDVDVYEAYRDTLEMTLPHVDRVVEDVSGRLVVSSDHGNVFGRRPLPYPFKVYGHPPGVHLEDLVRVPWVVFSSDSRRDLSSEEKISQDGRESAAVEERLHDLGYRD